MLPQLVLLNYQTLKGFHDEHGLGGLDFAFNKQLDMFIAAPQVAEFGFKKEELEKTRVSKDERLFDFAYFPEQKMTFVTMTPAEEVPKAIITVFMPTTKNDPQILPEAPMIMISMYENHARMFTCSMVNTNKFQLDELMFRDLADPTSFAVVNHGLTKIEEFQWAVYHIVCRATPEDAPKPETPMTREEMEEYLKNKDKK